MAQTSGSPGSSKVRRTDAIAKRPQDPIPALFQITQDINALLSLSAEAVASYVWDWWGSVSSLDLVLRRDDGASWNGSRRCSRGMAVVVIGADEAAGQALTLFLAKAGYTVFPLVPPASPSASSPLSHLLLQWSSVHKRLLGRDLHHAGAVIPIITGKEAQHVGDAVRAYCRDHQLDLAAVICSPRSLGLPLNPLAATSSQDVTLLYQANIAEPLGAVKDLVPMLQACPGRGRVVVISGGASDGGLLDAARHAVAQLLSRELDRRVCVCQVFAGPHATEPASPGRRRLALLAKLWAVDDALIYSAVRRAIEDRYPRFRHHAGISPLLSSIADMTPGGSIAKAVGRWVLQRLLG